MKAGAKMKLAAPPSDDLIVQMVATRAEHKLKEMKAEDLKAVVDTAKWAACSAIFRGDFATASKHLSSLVRSVPLQPPYASGS